ncbi:MAG TPA: tetratricopeptide repeat protein [Candidatus Acidoferrales bacterium]
MSFSFQDRRRRAGAVCAALVVFGVLVSNAAVRWRADAMARSNELEAWQRAAALEPSNAEHWYRIGRFWHLDLLRGDLDQAITAYQRAVELQPGAAHFWLDLASAYEMKGDTQQAAAAFEQAHQVYPESARVSWARGNFLLRRGDLDGAFADMRHAVEHDPNLTFLAVSVAWRASGEAGRVLRDVLPASASSYRSALNFFLAQQQPEAAMTAWEALCREAPRQELAASFPLITLLLRTNRWNDARRVWREAHDAAGETPPEPAGALVEDGGFERPPSGGGFGWRIQQADGLRIDTDSVTPHAGGHSLRVTFDGTLNLNVHHVTQLVLVEPGARYRFRGWMRSETISTDSGVRFGLRDMRYATRLNLLTPEVRGTEPWALHEVEFITSQETRLVEISVRRLPSRRLDNKLRGVVWVDDVSLERIDALAPSRATGTRR